MAVLNGRARYLTLLSLTILGVLFVLYDSLRDKVVELPQPHGFLDTQFDFQQDLTSINRPKRDLSAFRDHNAHNFKTDAQTSQQTFATFLCTRNGSIHDPYFAATLNLVYRNLWSPSTASKSRPFTVFVAPFITQEQRDILAGAGAIIQELSLMLWEPTTSGVYDRWRDQFSKLHLWYQTQYSTIVFMDSDAFPIRNIDEIFDEVKDQHCELAKVMLEDFAEPEKDALCDYLFAGVRDLGGGVNGGFLVLKPNQAMHKRLLREFGKIDQYDNSQAEQSFFRWFWAEDGAFPAQMLPRRYNAYFPNAEDEGHVSIVHEKLWVVRNDTAPWLKDIWRDGWTEMVEFFDSDEFVRARGTDGKPEPQNSELSLAIS